MCIKPHGAYVRTYVPLSLLFYVHVLYIHLLNTSEQTNVFLPRFLLKVPKDKGKQQKSWKSKNFMRYVHVCVSVGVGVGVGVGGGGGSVSVTLSHWQWWCIVTLSCWWWCICDPFLLVVVYLL